MEFGLETSNATKWVRRSDFEVSHSKLDLKKLKLVDISFQGASLVALALPVGNFITDMVEMENKTGEFEIEGMFADVFFSLQVSH